MKTKFLSLTLLLIVFLSGYGVSPKHKAIKAARNLILKYSKSPSTITFVADSVVASTKTGTEEWYLVYEEFDGQNPMGAILRGKYLICIRFNIGESENFKYDEENSIQEIDELNKKSIYLVQLFNDWPNLQKYNGY